MKILLKSIYSFIILSIISINSYAQIDIGKPGNRQNKKTINILENIAKYNGAIVGYSTICNTANRNNSIIKDKMDNTLKGYNIKNEEITRLNNIFEDTSNTIIRTRKYNSEECSKFNLEYQKIQSSIK